MDLALAERQFAWPLAVMFISPARDRKFPPNMYSEVLVAEPAVAEMLIPPPVVASET